MILIEYYAIKVDFLFYKSNHKYIKTILNLRWQLQAREGGLAGEHPERGWVGQRVGPRICECGQRPTFMQPKTKGQAHSRHQGGRGVCIGIRETPGESIIGARQG